MATAIPTAEVTTVVVFTAVASVALAAAAWAVFMVEEWVASMAAGAVVVGTDNIF